MSCGGFSAVSDDAEPLFRGHCEEHRRPNGLRIQSDENCRAPLAVAGTPSQHFSNLSLSGIVSTMTARPSHLNELEAESIYILREVAAQAARPVLLYSIGKDSSALLHLARKAFYPARPPFPFLHIDTKWKFRDMITFRDATAKRLGLDLRLHTNPDGLRDGINPFDHGGAYTQIMKTDALKQALTEGRYDTAIGGARRDEERSAPKNEFSPSARSRPHVGTKTATSGTLASVQRQSRAG